MPRNVKADPSLPKPKRIRKKPVLLNPTYASLKTGSQQKNPIVFVAYGTNVYVMRKLLFTEEILIPELVTVNLDMVGPILRKLAMCGARTDERVQEAILSNTDMQAWREKFNINDGKSLYTILSKDERDIVTLYHVFKLWPGRFVPHAIASIAESATSFHHKQRNRSEPVHCRVVFTGAVVEGVSVESQILDFPRTNYVPPPKPVISADLQLEMNKILEQQDLLHPRPGPKFDFYTQERVYVSCRNDIYCMPLLAITEDDTEIPSKIVVDLDEVGLILEAVRDIGLYIDERANKAFFHSTRHEEWLAERHICAETSIYTIMTKYSRNLVTLYWFFYKSPAFEGKPEPIDKLDGIDDIACEIVFVGIDPFPDQSFWPAFA